MVWYHFRGAWETLLPALRPFGAAAGRGHLGVDLFFLLSGFILAYVYRAGEALLDPRSYARFLWLRLARIYPNHLATLLLLVLLAGGAKLFRLPVTGDYPWSGLPFQLTLTHAWPSITGGGWNYPSWSISAEWFAYLAAFPAASWLLRQPFMKASGLGWAFALLGAYLLLSPGNDPRGGLALLQVTAEFLAGALLFAGYAAHPRVVAIFHRLATAALVAVVALALLPTQSRAVDALLILLLPILLLGLTAETSLLARFLSTRALLWGGRVSYALYMTHALSQKILKFALPAERFATASLATRLAVFFAQIAFLTAFAAALYYLVELPARKLLRRWRFPVRKPRTL